MLVANPAGFKNWMGGVETIPPTLATFASVIVCVYAPEVTVKLKVRAARGWKPWSVGNDHDALTVASVKVWLVTVMARKAGVDGAYDTLTSDVEGENCALLLPAFTESVYATSVTNVVGDVKVKLAVTVEPTTLKDKGVAVSGASPEESVARNTRSPAGEKPWSSGNKNVAVTVTALASLRHAVTTFRFDGADGVVSKATPALGAETSELIAAAIWTL